MTAFSFSASHEGQNMLGWQSMHSYSELNHHYALFGFFFFFAWHSSQDHVTQTQSLVTKGWQSLDTDRWTHGFQYNSPHYYGRHSVTPPPPPQLNHGGIIELLQTKYMCSLSLPLILLHTLNKTNKKL